MRAPVDGYVFNLTQFTEGGVAGPGERLLDIVPTGAPLVLNARVKPNDIAEVHVGMKARVILTAFNPRTTPPIDGTVVLVSADATYVVQVNGKKRGELTIDRDADPKQVEAAALALDGVVRAMDNKRSRRVIIVPHRIVNVVV